MAKQDLQVSCTLKRIRARAGADPGDHGNIALKWFDLFVQGDFKQIAGDGIGCNGCPPTGAAR